jgi:hypothetical protein
VGLYAVKPTFSDGHASGIFSWGYLRWLADHQAALWQDYLDRLAAAGASRDPDPNAPPTPSASGCASHGKSASPAAQAPRRGVARSRPRRRHRDPCPATCVSRPLRPGCPAQTA